MSKVFVQCAALAVMFFGTWFLLSKINFIKRFHIEELGRDNERRLGELVLDEVRMGHRELESDSVQAFVNRIKRRLCATNGIVDSSITLHILIRDDVNAFALPNRHLVVYTGLITYCSSAEELGGVLAHEIAHMEYGHVMKKLMKEVGLSMLMTIAGGDAGGQIARQTARLLSSTAFDRDQESEADIAAVHMMAKADIDPGNFANLLFRLSQEKGSIPRHFEWLSTHPDSRDRASEILKLRKQETYRGTPLATSAKWTTIRKIVTESQSD